MSSNKVYQPLDSDREEIRILNLYGSQKAESILEGHLEIVSLHADPKPQYECISYCWGEVSGIEIVRLNGLDLEVPASSAKVLRQFRPSSNSRKLWIDAVCINQADIEERGSQVSIMGQVFAGTEKCLIWLGDADATTQPLLKALKTMSDEFYDPVYEALNEFRGNEYPRDFQYPSDPVTTLFTECDPKDFIAFFERAWFRRVWVQQESNLAPLATCHCGPFEITWRDTCRAARLLLKWSNIEARFGFFASYATLDGLVLAWIYGRCMRRGENGMPLHNLLNYTWNLESMDVRDKFYSILGLIEILEGTDEFMHWFQVDYGKSVIAVLTDATLTAFIREGSLGALEVVDSGVGVAPLEGDFPSWVLRFDVKRSEADIRHVFMAECSCSSLPLDRAMLASCAGRPYIVLKGYEMDRVDRILMEYIDSYHKLNTLLMMLEAGDLALTENKMEKPARSFLDCLTAGNQTQRLASLSEHGCRQILDKMNRMCTTAIKNKDGIEDNSESCTSTQDKLADITRLIYDDALTFCAKRSLFLGSDGRFGLGHPSLEVDDCIAALAGGEYLCILRPYDPPDPNIERHDGIKTKTYRFIGLAYMPGLMDGKIAMARYEAGEQPEVFEIW